MKTRPKTAAQKHAHQLGVTIGPRVMLMSGPPSSPQTSDPPRIFTNLERIYQELFRDPQDPSAALELGAALANYSPNKPATHEPLNEVLRRLNNGERPAFNAVQVDLLQRVFQSTNPISPVHSDPNLAILGRRFFQALVFGPIDQVRELWALLHTVYPQGSSQIDPQARANVVDCLQKMVPESSWTDEQLAALHTLAVKEPVHRPLAWWDTINDAW